MGFLKPQAPGIGVALECRDVGTRHREFCILDPSSETRNRNSEILNLNPQSYNLTA